MCRVCLGARPRRLRVCAVGRSTNRLHSQSRAFLLSVCRNVVPLWRCPDYGPVIERLLEITVDVESKLSECCERSIRITMFRVSKVAFMNCLSGRTKNDTFKDEVRRIGIASTNDSGKSSSCCKYCSQKIMSLTRDESFWCCLDGSPKISRKATANHSSSFASKGKCEGITISISQSNLFSNNFAYDPRVF